MKHSPTELAHHASLALRGMQDADRAIGVQRYFKNAIVSLGIRTPAVRTFAREQIRLLKSSCELSEVLRYTECLLGEPELEIRVLAIFVLGAFAKQLPREFESVAYGWLQERLDNWALVDGFCGSVLSPLLEAQPTLEGALELWTRDKGLWVRRASLVALIPSARRGRRLDTVYRLVKLHFQDSEDLMHKAMGWLLREAGKADLNRLESFLLQHRSAIPRTTVRYAIERFALPDRATLLRATRRSVREEENSRSSAIAVQ